jgi:uncharacterized membrane protein
MSSDNHLPTDADPNAHNDWRRESCDLIIARPAAHCFALFTAFERTPQWLVELRSARTRKFDAEGRAVVVDYMAAPVRGGYTYPMCYVYDPDGRGLRWQGEVHGGARSIEGAVRFEPLDAARCEMRYTTAIRLAADMPAWFRSAQQDRPAEQLCRAFKSWAEGPT